MPSGKRGSRSPAFLVGFYVKMLWQDDKHGKGQVDKLRIALVLNSINSYNFILSLVV